MTNRQRWIRAVAFILAITQSVAAQPASLPGDRALTLALVNIKSLYTDSSNAELNRKNLEANLYRHLYFVDLATKTPGVDFVGFPELSLNGYHFSTNMTWLKIDGPEIAALKKKAVEKGVTIGVGVALEDADGRRWNVQIMIDPQGRIVAMHRKIYLTKEKGFVEVGAEHKVFDIKGVKMGIAICADGSDKKNLEALAKNGAELVYGPHANTTGGTIAGWYKFRSNWVGPKGWIAELKLQAALHNHAGLYEPKFDPPPGGNVNTGWASGAMFVDSAGEAVEKMPASTRREDSKEFILIHTLRFRR